MTADTDGLFGGFGNPPCPKCGTNGHEATDFRDWTCPSGHTWRAYGNGGLEKGTVPRCRKCGLLPVNG